MVALEQELGLGTRTGQVGLQRGAETTTGQVGRFRDGHVYYLNCSDGFTGVSRCQTFSNCT